MSLGFIQLGQCGNQIGHALFDFMIQETQMSSPGAQALLNEIFFFERKNKQIAKSLLIDMEPKVVDRCLKAEYYDKAFSLTKQEGSGNNWAYGFNNHGPANKNAILQIMDSLLEECGYLESLFFISSLAGGTGSGLGSYILELMADRYPEIELFNICVMPHLTGEVILQSLNTVLTIGSIYQHSEGIILLQNDEAQALCNNLLNLKSPSLNDINQVMSTNLASFFWPCLTNQVYSTFHNNLQYVQELLNITNNQYKLLQLNQIPQLPQQSKAFQNDTWSALEKRIQQMVMTGTKEYNINWHKKGQQPFKQLMIARGNDVKKHQFNWNTVQDEHQFNKNEKSITVLHNSSNIVESLNQISDRANQMIQERAYLYQYEKFGVKIQHFQESMGIVEGIINDYEQLIQ
ncbi:unnamed protein product [Paramecium octaurelia]|uniref:Tubulin/FtsZ GTPase domain-containing protein n=1 Tax=Paramecium octaurelia TaxID=43137 RepID=A0A8S1T2W5_PAROT|nr:unnamed protein product [Paramecium octaurelia]